MCLPIQEMQETQVQSLSWDDLEKEIASHSSVFAWKIPWTGGLQSTSCKESSMIEWLCTHAQTYIHVSLCGHFPSTWLHIRSGIVTLYGNIFLITNDVECLLCAYWPLVYFLFWCDCLIFCPFFWVVFLLSFKRSLYILDTNPLSDVDIYMSIHIDVDIYMSCQINIFIPVSVLPFKFC